MSSSPDGTDASSGPPTGPTSTPTAGTEPGASGDSSGQVVEGDVGSDDSPVTAVENVRPPAPLYPVLERPPSDETVTAGAPLTVEDPDEWVPDDGLDDDTVIIRTGDRTEVISPVALREDATTDESGQVAGLSAAATTAPPEDVSPEALSTSGVTSPVTIPSQESAVSDESVLSDFDRTETSRRWPRTLLWAACAVLVLAGAYVGAQWYFADRIPRETTVAGIDIGGLSHQAAVERLQTELGGIAAEPLPVTAGDATTTLDPAVAGLRFDPVATVDGLTSFSLAPSRLLAQISGGDAVEPVTVVDEAALGAAVDTMALDLEVDATSGTVSFVDGAAVSTSAVDGSGADVEAATELVRTTWLTATRPLVLPTVPVEPEITQAETDAALVVAQKVASAPVTVTVAGQIAEIPVATMTAAASMIPVDGALQLSFDGELLVKDVVARTTALLSDAADASFVFVDGAPQVRAGVAGTTLDPATLAGAVQTAATGDNRTAPVELVESDPAQSTSALEALGVTQVVAEFATPLTNEPVRTENLRIAAERVTGTLVRPGEVFDLTKVIGPITAANGYKAAHIISNGEIVDGIGGGLSQMSTTTYNAGFFAGMVDLEHRPHSYWFDRYPEGRESTLAVGQINMRWRNDSPYGVLMQSYIADGKLHVVAWSTPYYTVTSSTSPRSDVVAATIEHASGAGCAAQSRGNSGFAVTVSRKVVVTATGAVVIDESNTWRYRPQNGVVCDAPPAG